MALYKSTEASPMDYMYKMDIPLMQQALQYNDAQVNREVGQATQLGSIADKIPALDADSDRVQEIAGDYEKKVDDLTKSIQTDPTNWRDKQGDITKLQKDLQANFQNGEISKIMANKAAYDQMDSYISEREKAGKITPYEGAAFRAKALESLKDGTKYNPGTGDYNTISTIKPMDTINIRDRLKNYVDKMKASGQLRWDTKAGQYIMKTTQGEEGVSPDQIINAAMSGALGDQELLQYLKERSSYGIINGVTDANGRFISPYTYQPQPITDVEKGQITDLSKQINAAKTRDPKKAAALQSQLDQLQSNLNDRKQLQGNPNSVLFEPIQSLADEYSYNNVKQGVDIHNNSLYDLGVSEDFQAGQKKLDREQRAAEFNGRMMQAQQFFDDKMAWEKYKWDHPQAKGGKLLPGQKPGQTPSITVDGMQSVHPYASDNLYTNEGLTATLDKNNGANGKTGLIDQYTKQIGQYNQQIAAITRGRTMDQLTPDERAQVTRLSIPMSELQNRLNGANMESDLARQHYVNALNYALHGVDDQTKMPNMTDAERSLYAQFTNDRDGSQTAAAIKKEGQDKGYLDELQPDGMAGSQARIAMQHDPGYIRWQAKQAILDHYLDLKKHVDKLRQGYLDQLKNTTNQAPSMEFGSQDSEAVGQLLDHYTHGMSIYDASGHGGQQGIEGGLSFADNSLPDYIKQHGGKIQYLGASHTLGFNEGDSGAAVRVRIVRADGKDGDVGKIPSNQDFYITLNPESQTALGQKFVGSSNPTVAKVAKQMLNDRDQVTRNALLQATGFNEGTQPGTEAPATKQVTLPTVFGPKYFTVRTFYRGNGDNSYYITVKDKNGNDQPIISQSGAGDGWFESIDDFLDNMDKNGTTGKYFK